MFNAAKTALLKGEIDLENGDIRAALVDETYVPDGDTDVFFSDVSGEISGTSYTAGGKLLANPAITQDSVNDRAVLSADDLSWPLGTFVARAAVLYKDTGAPSSSPVIAYVDFNENRSVSGEDFTIEWHSEGILYLGG